MRRARSPWGPPQRRHFRLDGVRPGCRVAECRRRVTEITPTGPDDVGERRGEVGLAGPLFGLHGDGPCEPPAPGCIYKDAPDPCDATSYYAIGEEG